MRTIGILLLLTAITAPALRAEELIRNGDFSAGNKQFTSDYKHSHDNIKGEFTYAVANDPNAVHDDAVSFGDHTDGKGLMMAVNGSRENGRVLWSQSIEVRPDAEYTFSLWLANWYAPSPTEVEVRIDGKSIDKVVAPGRAGVWKQLKVGWHSGRETISTVEILSITRGNGFAIDDISLRGPSPLPDDAANRIREHEEQVTELRRKLALEIEARRQSLISDLQKLQDDHTKQGKLDDAVAIRSRIRRLRAEPGPATVPSPTEKPDGDRANRRPSQDLAN